LCVLQEGIRPEVVTAFDLEDCKASWSLFNHSKDKTAVTLKPDKEGKVQQLTPNPENMHDFLVISRKDSTMVLATGDDLEEITDRVDFFTNGPTFDIGNVCNNTRIVQVYNNKVLLLNGGKLLFNAVH
jgi:cleavage and polyadenylation specificity factor subunit 1